MLKTLQDKTAFITGGTSGIGLGMAHAFVAAGARVLKLRPDPALSKRPLTPLQRELRDRALSPLKVGQRVVKGILANELYIITHPEVRELVEARCCNLLAHFGESADPDLPLDRQWRDLA